MNNKLLAKIQTAQIHAAEQVVLDDLRQRGLDDETLRRGRLQKARNAIITAWEQCRDVPFPLYETEADAIAAAVVAALDLE